MMLSLQIDRQRNQPAGEQIKDRVRYAFATGQLRPGDALPSVRDVAADTGVSRNTVHRAYRALEEEGTVVCWQGKGAFIVERAVPSDAGTMERANSQADRLLRALNLAGVHPLSFARFCVHRFQDFDHRHPRIAVVELGVANTARLAAEVRRRWGVAVEELSLEALRDRSKRLTTSLSYLLTNYVLVREVRKLAPDGTEVLPLAVRLHLSVQRALREIDEDALVAVYLEKLEWRLAAPFYRRRIEEILGDRHGRLDLVHAENAAEVLATSERLQPALAFLGDRLSSRIPRFEDHGLRRLAISVDITALHTICHKAGVLIPSG
ncbi:MAG: GntR family transcriptional regulator [Acidobacteriota bacterium]